MTTARDLMHPCPTVAESDTVSHLVAQMAGHDSSVLAVLDAKGRLSGIVTEFDLVRLIYESGEYEVNEVVGGRLPTYLGYTPEQLKALTAGEIMTNDPETVAPDTTVNDVAEALFRNRRKVLLVAEKGQVLGVVRRLDLVRRVLG
ncbi:MAG TPA: CBS domain-containing protein [Symbiobacteriaceae bacterium]|nr:CBS domain-containing protein [Symbiobacteriaceae bacterium]